MDPQDKEFIQNLTNLENTYLGIFKTNGIEDIKRFSFSNFSDNQKVQLAKCWYDILYKNTNDDFESICNLTDSAHLVDLFDKYGSVVSLAALAVRASMVVPSEQMYSLFWGRWFEQGLPRISIDSKYASMLMATEANEETLEDIIPPWKAFVISITGEPILSSGEDGELEEPINNITVQIVKNTKGEDTWNFIAINKVGLTIWRYGLNIKQLLTVDKETLSDDTFEPFILPFNKKDDRIMALVGHLIISTCLAMSDKLNFHEQKQTKGRGHKWRLSKTPTVRNIVLGKPIKLDCRPAIRDYVAGTMHKKGTLLKVQFLVRGHWRRTPYGPKSTLRKIQHIEPYWKGPEDARIVGRP